MNKAFYAFGHALAKAWFTVFMPTEISGAENIPESGPCIICSNHLAFIDPFFIACHCKLHIRFMAKKELFENKLTRWIVDGLGAYPVARGERDMNAIRTTFSLLKDGHAIGIFPEGTRSKDGETHEMHTGIALIALRSGAPVYPAAISGKYRLFRKVRVAFGKPVDLSDMNGKIDAESLKKATERIYQVITGLEAQ